LYFYCSILPVGFGFAAALVPLFVRRVRQPTAAQRLANPVFSGHLFYTSHIQGIFVLIRARACVMRATGTYVGVMRAQGLKS
jgi:hypothetical protein